MMESTPKNTADWGEGQGAGGWVGLFFVILGGLVRGDRDGVNGGC